MVRVAGSGPATVETHDGNGLLVATNVLTARAVPVAVPAGGFALVTR